MGPSVLQVARKTKSFERELYGSACVARVLARPRVCQPALVARGLGKSERIIALHLDVLAAHGKDSGRLKCGFKAQTLGAGIVERVDGEGVQVHKKARPRVDSALDAVVVNFGPLTRLKNRVFRAVNGTRLVVGAVDVEVARDVLEGVAHAHQRALALLVHLECRNVKSHRVHRRHLKAKVLVVKLVLAAKKLKSASPNESVKVKVEALVNEDSAARGVQAHFLGVAQPNSVHPYNLEVEVEQIQLGVHSVRNHRLKANDVVVALFAVVQHVLAGFRKDFERPVVGVVAHETLKVVLHHEALAGVHRHVHADRHVFDRHARPRSHLANRIEQHERIFALKSLKGRVAVVAVVLVALKGHRGAATHVDSAHKYIGFACGPPQLVEVHRHVVVAVGKRLQRQALVGAKDLKFPRIGAVLYLHFSVVQRILFAQAERKPRHLGCQAVGANDESVGPDLGSHRGIANEVKHRLASVGARGKEVGSD